MCLSKNKRNVREGHGSRLKINYKNARKKYGEVNDKYKWLSIKYKEVVSKYYLTRLEL